LTVLIKSLGDWTKDLVAHANECKEKNVLPTVYVDGFHGGSLEMYGEYSAVLLVGGGIGVTPLFAILEDLAAKLEAHEMLTQKVIFTFSFRELALLEEIHPVLTKLKMLDPQEFYFKTHFYLTRPPSDEILSRNVDASRLRGKHTQPTTYLPSLTTPVALAETLRSRTYRVLVFTTVVVVTVLALIYIEYGNPSGKIVRTGEEFWPLQAFISTIVLMVLSMGIVFAYVFAERLSKLKVLASTTTATSKEVEINLFQALETPALVVSDVHSYRDLLSHYKVVLGERPDVKAIVKEAHEFCSDSSVPSEGKPVVGVFVSGPEAMTRAVEYAVQEIGVSHFDIHEEEFEM
jgi:ferredoxin-NADP reductase